jgi:CMP/dCMP kinase
MNLKSKIIIAIDGFASTGKSTLAKDLAKDLNYIYIDSGAMYRAVTLFVMQNNFFIADKINVDSLYKNIDKIDISFKYNSLLQKSETFLNNTLVEDKIRSMEVSNLVSPVSTIKFVRERLVALQKKMGENKGIVMDGRDIGTVVFPDAEIKFFIIASPQVRARRRYDELSNKGDKVIFEEILKNVIERDKIDSTREIGPLKKADDAIELDNSNMTIIEQYDWAKKIISEKFGIYS